MTVWVDTLEAAGILEKAGFSEKQAKAVVKVLTPVSEDVATRTFVKDTVDTAVKEIKLEMQSLEHRTTARIYGSQIAAVVAVIGALKFFGVF